MRTASAVRIGTIPDGRHVVTIGDGMIVVCPTHRAAEEAARVIELGLNSGVLAALSISGVVLASSALIAKADNCPGYEPEEDDNG